MSESGTVIWFDTAKGYGFIAPDLGGRDVFVHVHDLLGDLDEIAKGQRVTFEQKYDAARGGKIKAVNVAPVEQLPARDVFGQFGGGFPHDPARR